MNVDDLFPPRANMPWLRERTILFTRHGSHAYGLNTATSDEDYKGVAVPPTDYFLGFSKDFEQAESKDPDLVIYEVRKFFKLAAQGNPNIIEVLWTDESDHLIVTSAGRLLLENRALFLSKKVKHTFSGYAIAQLKRIKGHKRWLDSGIDRPPTREEFGLRPENELTPEQRDQLGAAMAMIQKEVATWDELQWTNLDDAARIELKGKIVDFLARTHVTKDQLFLLTGRQLGYDDNFLDILRREKLYRAKKQEWEGYQNWLKDRNKVRAELEAKFGYDAKHAMHLVRLLKMCREILTTGHVVVKRPDREELLAIRNGAWSYEKLVEWAEIQDKELNDVYKTSKLPHAPDTEKLDRLCMQIVSMTT